MNHGKRVWLRRLALLQLAACAPDQPSNEPPASRPEEGVPPAAQTDERAPLEQAALRILSFLQGDADFPAAAFADSVALYAGAEAGGRSLTYSREQLRDRAAWRVPINGHHTQVAPSDALTQVTTKAGAHFRCFEYPLEAHFARLAGYPHVGVKLEPRGADSCLQSWNLTLVFDSLVPRRLIAAVYDQWEW